MQVAVIHKAFEDTPRTVAFVDVADDMTVEEALEYAYRWTNNVMGSWRRKEQTFDNGEANGDYNPTVKVMATLNEGGMGLRSTSMGDQMLVGTTLYAVAMMGFEAVV